jgi:flagellin-like protein
MSNRYLKKIDQNRRKKAGISPVVATVILVAVAVVIAAALAGFSGSLFGSYSNGPQVKIQSMTIHEDGSIELTMSNAGNAADTVTKISVNGHGETGALDAGAGVVAANSNPIDVDLTGADDLTDLSEGMQITAIIQMQSGSSITQTVTVVA